jgi:hypothetical protein
MKRDRLNLNDSGKKILEKFRSFYGPRKGVTIVKKMIKEGKLNHIIKEPKK